MTTAKLTDRQRRFVQEYVIDFNATRAAVAVGYSAATARQIGAENLSKPVIRSEINRQIKQRSIELDIEAKAIIGELVAMLRADIADIFDENNAVRPFNEMPKEFRNGLIRSIKIREETNTNGEVTARRISIQFSDRTAIMRQLGKHLGCW
jgi:phage terminase small subunit